MFGWYKNEKGRDVISINKFEAAQYLTEIGIPDNKFDLFKLKEPIYIKNEFATLIHVFEIGQRVIFCDSKEELLDIVDDKTEVSKRLYFVKRLHQASVGNIQFQHHLEDRSDDELKEAFPKEKYKSAGKDGFSNYQKDFIAPRILFKPTNSVFFIEGKDFEIQLDGEIILKI